MRFYQLIQDAVRFEELKPLLFNTFVHDKNDPSLFFKNVNVFLKNIRVFESLSDTHHENYFFQRPSTLCILLKGRADFFFRDFSIGQLEEVEQPKIIYVQDYMYNQPFRVVCTPKTEILFLGLGGEEKYSDTSENYDDNARFTKFIQNEMHRNIGLYFKSPIDSISIKLDEFERQFAEDSTKIGVQHIKKIRTQLAILSNHVKKSIVKSDMIHGTESLKLIRSNPEEILLDFFNDIGWDANLNSTYTDENVKAFIDAYKFKNALNEIVTFFLQNKPADFRHQWIINDIKGREQIEILFYFSSNHKKDPELFENDREANTISVQDNLPLLNEIILNHKGTTQIYEKNETLKIKIIIPKNLWRIQIKPLHIFIIDVNKEDIEKITHSLVKKFNDVNVMNFDNIDSAIKGFYQYQPEAIFYNIDHVYDGIDGKNLLNKLYVFFKDAGTEECIFVPLSKNSTWESIETRYPEICFSFMHKPIADIELERTIRLVFTFIERYRILKRNYRDVKMSAERDGLTGLYNRWYMDEYSNQLLKQSQDSNSSFSLIITDIDNFKVYNDTNGHQSGDKALQKFSRVLSGSVRLSDTVTRYGGEEFVILLPHTSKKNALNIADKIKINIENEPFDNEVAQPLKKVTASFGVANYPEDGKTIAAILKKSDDNLYTAKDQGRNRVIG